MDIRSAYPHARGGRGPALRRWRYWIATLALAALAPAWAQDDAPGRVGRLAELQGTVSWFDADAGAWRGGELNRPLTAGDRIATGAASRTEIDIGSSVLRLGPYSEIALQRLDDQRVALQLEHGSAALRLRSDEVARETEVTTPEVRLLPLRAGYYRIDRDDGATSAASWSGVLRIDDYGGIDIGAGRAVRMVRDGGSGLLNLAWGTPVDDPFAAWALREDANDARYASSAYVPLEMTGATDLGRYGVWAQSAEYGAVWYPTDMPSDWVPYRYGRWAWVRPWGWTWVDDAPWGFAPFHYGRWAYWRNRWCWVPGRYDGRPVYAPALVAWVGGAGWSLSVGIGAPTVGWIPLGPQDRYRPDWGRGHDDRHDRDDRRDDGDRHRGHDGPRYVNEQVPGAVTVVPRDVLVERKPVPRDLFQGRGALTPPQHANWTAAPPPAPPARV
ncbi:MAG: hypothetical protein KGO01_21610, partial [Burkholderiales bacterium]|nr:hypothetical protein [Burkholderiales bacterium]